MSGKSWIRHCTDTRVDFQSGLGFKAMEDVLTGVFYHLCAVDSSSATPAELLAVNVFCTLMSRNLLTVLSTTNYSSWITKLLEKFKSISIKSGVKTFCFTEHSTHPVTT